jgi:hypothetical protein
MRHRRRFPRLSLSLSLLATMTFLLLPAAGVDAAGTRGRWSPVEAQLTRDKVIPGSALEKLIRANQDTSVLGPNEREDDGIGLPLWLRVLWKKDHPESRELSDDPSGGYPLVLQEAREWLLNHQDLKPVPNKKAASISEKLSVAGSSEKRISGSAPTFHRSESDIRVFYSNPTRIVAACNNNTTTGHQTQMYSSDSGANWTQTSLDLTGTDAYQSDPAVDWTSDGTSWTTTIGVQLTPSVALRLRAYRSTTTTSQGTSWTFDGTPSDTQTNADKELIWVDHSSSSMYRDTVYAIWHAGAPTFVSRRTGGTWSAPLQLTGAETTGNSIGSDIKTNSNGEVFAFWPSSGNRRMYVAKSTNGGTSFNALGAPVIIATTNGSYQIGIPAANARRPIMYVSGGTFRDATRDMVYALWMDLNQSGCTVPLTVSSTCKTRIWFNRSTNGGASWGTAVMINNQGSLNDQFNPWLLVDEKTGGLTVIYYDTVGDANRVLTKVWAQYSGNDGASWGGAVQVSSAQTFEPESYPDSYASQYGDYNALSGIAGTLFPSWTDRRNNTTEEIWTAKLINPNYEGYNDGATCEMSWGWAWDRNAQSSTANVDVYDGSTLLGTTAAGLFRQDLLNAGIGNGFHAFSFFLPSSQWDGNTHSIRTRFGGTTSDLSLTPRSITCTTIFTTQTPQNNLAGSNFENSTIFTSSVAGKIVAIRFYKAPGEGGTHVGNLWADTGGSPLASVTFTNETSSGWQTQFLPNPVTIAAGTRYRVSYGFNNVLSKTDCGLGTPVSHGPLTTVGSAYSTPNGTFPNTGSCSNFFADVIFSP